MVNYALFHTDMESIDIDDIGTYQLNSDEDKSKAGLNIQEKLKKMDNNKKESVINELINLTDVNIPEKLGKKYIFHGMKLKE